ncbi:hypothetical protein ACFLUG_02705 [Chloroflexota bacterium]
MAMFQKVIDIAQESQKTLDVTQKLIDSITSMIDSIKKTCDLPKKLRANVAIAEGNITIVRKLLRRMSSHPVMKALNIQLISLKRMLTVIRQSLSKLNIACIAIKAALKRISSKLDKFKSELKELNGVLDQLIKVAEFLEQQQSYLEKNLDPAIKAQIDMLTDEVSDISKKISRLNPALSDIADDMKSLADSIDTIATQLSTLNGVLTAISRQLASLRSTLQWCLSQVRSVMPPWMNWLGLKVKAVVNYITRQLDKFIDAIGLKYVMDRIGDLLAKINVLKVLADALKNLLETFKTFFKPLTKIIDMIKDKIKELKEKAAELLNLLLSITLFKFFMEYLMPGYIEAVTKGTEKIGEIEKEKPETGGESEKPLNDKVIRESEKLISEVKRDVTSLEKSLKETDMPAFEESYFLELEKVMLDLNAMKSKISDILKDDQ